VLSSPQYEKQMKKRKRFVGVCDAFQITLHLAPHRWALSGACYWNECILFIYIKQTIKGLHASTTKPIRRGLSSGPIYIIILQYMRGGQRVQNYDFFHCLSLRVLLSCYN